MDVTIELDPHGMADRLLEPGHGAGGQPVANLPGQFDLQVAVERSLVVTVREDRAFETKTDRANLFVVGQVEDTLGVIEIMVLNCPCFVAARRIRLANSTASGAALSSGTSKRGTVRSGMQSNVMSTKLLMVDILHAGSLEFQGVRG